MPILTRIAENILPLSRSQIGAYFFKFISQNSPTASFRRFRTGLKFRPVGIISIAPGSLMIQPTLMATRVAREIPRISILFRFLLNNGRAVFLEGIAAGVSQAKTKPRLVPLAFARSHSECVCADAAIWAWPQRTHRHRCTRLRARDSSSAAPLTECPCLRPGCECW